jgi:hypothetical protein
MSRFPEKKLLTKSAEYGINPRNSKRRKRIMNNKNRSKLFAVLAAAVITLTSFTTAHAQSSVPLSDLVGGGSLTSGDKLFNNWSFSAAGNVDILLTAGDINVIPITDIDGNFGFRLQSGFFAGAGQFADYLISYRVTVTDPTKQIIDLHLVFNGIAIGAGANTNVVETAQGTGGFITQLAVFHAGGTNFDLSDEALFPGTPQSFLDVSKDIFLTGGTQGFAVISLIDQSFSQTGRTDGVPEPSTLALFGVGAGTLGFLAWRRKNRAAAE